MSLVCLLRRYDLTASLHRCRFTKLKMQDEASACKFNIAARTLQVFTLLLFFSFFFFFFFFFFLYIPHFFANSCKLVSQACFDDPVEAANAASTSIRSAPHLRYHEHTQHLQSSIHVSSVYDKSAFFN